MFGQQLTNFQQLNPFMFNHLPSNGELVDCGSTQKIAVSRLCQMLFSEPIFFGKQAVHVEQHVHLLFSIAVHLHKHLIRKKIITRMDSCMAKKSSQFVTNIVIRTVQVDFVKCSFVYQSSLVNKPFMSNIMYICSLPLLQVCTNI